MNTKASHGKDKEVLCYSCVGSRFYEIEGAEIVEKNNTKKEDWYA